MKDRISRSDESEYEPIKIPQGNLGYILKSIRRVSLLARPRPHSYEEAISPQNQLRQPESQWKKTLGASRATCEISVNKIDKQSNLKPHAYFTEHLICMTEKPPQILNKNNEENLHLILWLKSKTSYTRDNTTRE
jgi:hypothetical protein